MAIAIRGSTPITGVSASGTGNASVTCTGARQPQSGDTLLIIYCNNYYTLANMVGVTVGGSSTGVVAVTGGTGDAGSNSAHVKSYTYPVASTGDLVVANVTETGTHDEEKAIIVYVLSGVDAATPIDIAGGAANASASTSGVAPSISPTTSDALLICHAGQTTSGAGGTSGTTTPPSGMAEMYDFNFTGNFGIVSGADLQLAASGATGTKTFTFTLSAGWAALSIALKTAGAAAALPPILVMPPRRP